MSPSAKRVWLAIAVIVAAILVMRSLVGEDQPRLRSDVQVSNKADATTDVRTVNAPARQPIRPAHIRTQPQEKPTTGIEFRSSEQLPPSPPVTGYVIDNYTIWKSIPEGYHADGIVTTANGITLSGDPASTTPRSGVLHSPPLPLRHPALEAPADESQPLPHAATVNLQISLSADGESWSPWLRVDRHTPADGNRIAPPMQASLAKADLERVDSNSSAPINGPAIRYRLGLSSSGTIAPVLSDIRVWKRETN